MPDVPSDAASKPAVSQGLEPPTARQPAERPEPDHEVSIARLAELAARLAGPELDERLASTAAEMERARAEVLARLTGRLPPPAPGPRAGEAPRRRLCSRLAALKGWRVFRRAG
jgi:hypothetical protein